MTRVVKLSVSGLTVKRAAGKRRISGIATTATPDRQGDIVEPLGAFFKNPIPFLHAHNGTMPIGLATLGKPTKNGIPFEAIIPDDIPPGALKDRVDMAWGEIQAGLVASVSIGFRALEFEPLPRGGKRFTSFEILELSACVVGAQPDAVITTVTDALNSGNAVKSAGDLRIKRKRGPVRLAPKVSRVVRLDR